MGDAPLHWRVRLFLSFRYSFPREPFPTRLVVPHRSLVSWLGCPSFRPAARAVVAKRSFPHRTPVVAKPPQGRSSLSPSRRLWRTVVEWLFRLGWASLHAARMVIPLSVSGHFGSQAKGSCPSRQGWSLCVAQRQRRIPQPTWTYDDFDHDLLYHVSSFTTRYRSQHVALHVRH